MKLSFKYSIKPNLIQKQIIDEIMWHSAKVYNTLNYEIIEKIEKVNLAGNLNIISSKIYKRYRKSSWHSKYLHSHTLQEVIINVLSNHKSYLEILKEYEKGNKEIKGKPRVPRYKKDNIQIVFTKYAIRMEKNKLKLSISKEMKEKFKVESLNFLISSKLRKLVDFSKIKMIKINKNGKEECEMIIIYEKEEKENAGTNVMAIDLGLNNLATCTALNTDEIFIVAGESIKSKINYINKEIEKYQRIQMKMVGSKKYKNTKRIKKLHEYRRNYINTNMHKVSKEIIEYAKRNDCREIIIGDLKDIKQGMQGNKNFVQMPIQNLVEKIKYKAKLEGIEVLKIKEEYTSGVSALDKEEIIKENYNKSRRISRGLFRTNTGKIINADVNGSLNILRKYIKTYSPNLEIAMDNGREQRPLKKRVA